MTVLEKRSHQFSAAVITDLKIMRNKGGLAPPMARVWLSDSTPLKYLTLPLLGSAASALPLCRQEDLALIKTGETNKQKIMRTIAEPLRQGHGLRVSPTILAPLASSLWH